LIGENRLELGAAYLTLVAAVLVLIVKGLAYLLTGSLALFSDAAESVVNVVAGVAVLVSVRLSLQPPDYEHPYGHAKAEYLSGALEGSMILVAALVIIYGAVPRLVHPVAVSRLGAGVLLSLLGSLINLGLFFRLRSVAERTQSMALYANSRHILTDLWTSAGVLLSIVIIGLTRWYLLDPLIAIAVALNIVREGWRVAARALAELMDTRLPEDEEKVIMQALDENPAVLGYHRLRSRGSGRSRFAEVDIFVDPRMSVKAAHELVARLEGRIIGLLPNLITTVHIEPYVAGKREGAVSPKDEFSHPGSHVSDDLGKDGGDKSDSAKSAAVGNERIDRVKDE
jgi:cation diffusion facilitator family transporter